MTWFDALLVTLLGMLGALGLRWGLSSLLWSLLVIAAAYLANLLGPALGPVGILLTALGLGLLAALAANASAQGLGQKLGEVYQVASLPSALSGLAGTVLLGTVVVAATALAFPLSPKVDATGVRYVYPAPEITPMLYQAVDGSAVKAKLMPLWQAQSPWKPLVLPDRVGLSQPPQHKH